MIQNGGNIVLHQKVEDMETTKWINYGDSGEGLYEVLLWCERGLVTKQEHINCVPDDGWADQDVTRLFKTEEEADFFVDVVLNLKKMMNVKLNHLEMHKFESYEDDASSDVLDEWTYHEYSRSYQTRNNSDEFISKAKIGFKNV